MTYKKNEKVRKMMKPISESSGDVPNKESIRLQERTEKVKPRYASQAQTTVVQKRCLKRIAETIVVK